MTRSFGQLFFLSFPISNRMKKKMQKKTLHQKTKEEFERIKEKRRQKKEVKCCSCLSAAKYYHRFCFRYYNPFVYILTPGIPEEQAAERRSLAEIQTEKDGNVSDAEQKD